MIIGSSNSVSAALLQSVGGSSYQFGLWSDGLGANHNVVAPAVPTTFTANYTALSPDLVAAYGFNEGAGTSATDESGKGHQATMEGPVWTTQGRFGNALSFDGVNDWVTIVDASESGPHNGDDRRSLGISDGNRGCARRPSQGRGERRRVQPVRAQLERAAGIERPGGSRQSHGRRHGAPGQHLDTPRRNLRWRRPALVREQRPGRQHQYQRSDRHIQRSSSPGWQQPVGRVLRGADRRGRIYNRALSVAELQTDMNTAIGGPDTTPPVLSGGAPSGVLAPGTTATTLSVATSENATCRYARNAGVSYGSMPSTFTTTGGQAHATTVSGLANGGSYSYYVRCADSVGNPTTSDYVIAFSVAQSDGVPPTVAMTAPAAGPTVFGNVTVSATASDNVGVAGVQFLLNGAALGAEERVGPVRGQLGVDERGQRRCMRCRRGRGTWRGIETTATAVNVTVNNTALRAWWRRTASMRGRGRRWRTDSGRGTPGTISGATWTTAGRYGGALTFDGVERLRDGSGRDGPGSDDGDDAGGVGVSDGDWAAGRGATC